ncbi:MAG: CARDB domain-containing protein [Candidatus Peregrinibacteria bacterium]
MALPKGATLDQAQMTVHAQKGRDELSTQSILESPVEIAPSDNQESVTENLNEMPSPDPLPTPASGHSGGGDVFQEDGLAVMSTTITITDHYITGSTDWNDPPRKSKFYLDETVGSWISLSNASNGGEVKWEFIDPAGQINGSIFPIPSGYSGYKMIVYYPSIWFVGSWSVKVYVRSAGESDFTHVITDNFTVHESSSIPPQVSIQHSPSDVYEDTLVRLIFSCSDNSETSEQVATYWNDGSGWQSKITNQGQPPMTYIICPQSSPLFLSSWTEIGPFPENTTVQYYATARDFEGNFTQTPTQSFTVQDSDTTGPTVSNFRIAEGTGADMDGSIDDTENIRISWDLSDPSGIKEIQLVIDGAPQTFAVNGGSFTLDLSPLVVGEHTYTLTATDNDNSPATTTKSETFAVVHRPILLNPSLDIGADGTVDWRFDGEMTEDQVLTAILDPLKTYLADHETDEDGRVTIPLLFHADKGYFMKAHQLYVGYRIIDTTPPTISNVVLNPASPQAGQSVAIAVTAFDNTKIKEVRAGFNDDMVLLISGDNNTFTGSLTAPAAGTHDLTVTATDLSGLTKTQVTPINIIFVGPELWVDSVTLDPAEPLLTGQTVQTTVTIRNTGNQQVDAEVYLAHVRNETQTLTVPAEGTVDLQTSFTLPTPGTHNFEVSVDPDNRLAESDETNNTFNYEYQTTDGTPPVLDRVNVPQQVGAGQSFTVSAVATDNIQIQSIWAELNGQRFDLVLEADDRYKAALTAPRGWGRSDP